MAGSVYTQFDEAYYLSQNPDVADAIARGDVGSAEEHFNLFGFSEGRDPNPYFDTSFYLEQNPDVASAGVNPLDHYNTYGAAEGRGPTPLFDPAFYAQENPDVVAAGIDPYEHFLANGASEGRAPNAEVAQQLASGFDEAAYLAANPDIAAAIANGSFSSGYAHWLLHGYSEDRPGVQNSNGDPISIGAGDTDTPTGEPVDNPTGGGAGGGGPVGDTTAPTFISNAAFVVNENTKDAGTVTATDASGPVTYALVGGADFARFEIDTNTGALTFKDAPDFEAPADAGGDNVYDVIVRATDAVSNSSDQIVSVSVSNVNELVVATSGGDYTSIQEAVDNASEGDTIIVRAGTYTLTGQLNISKSLAIIGAGEGDVTINTAVSSNGIHVTADNVSISDLTLNAFATTHYGIKVNPGNGALTDALTGFQLENVTVKNAGKSEIDLNGVDNSTLTNVTADGMNTSGVGIALSDSTGIVLTDITTTGNNWGSVGLYTKGQYYPPAGTSDISFVGSYSHGEAIGIYADEEPTAVGSLETFVTDIDFAGIFPSGVYAVRNDTHRGGFDDRNDDFTYFFGSEADAVAFATGIVDGHAANVASDSVITGPFDPSSVDAELGTPLASGSTFIVGAGMSIQEAIDHASDGDTIIVRAGTYNESLIIDKAVTLESADGPGAAVITGTLLTDLRVPAGTGLDEFFEANHPSYSGSKGITINVDNVTLDGFTITGYGTGVELGSSNGVSLINNVFTDNVAGLRKGTAAEVTNITVTGNTFTKGIYGINIYAASNDSGAFDGVTMNNNTFSDLSEKGMYFEQLSHASLTGNSFNGVGNYGRVSAPFGGTDGEFGQAIDINLKYETYQNVVFTDTVITNSGYSNKEGAGAAGDFGAAIGVKIRDDGATYGGADSASFDGQIKFLGGSIDGTSTGFRIGEPGKNNDGPNVLIDDVLIRNATVTDVENAAKADSGNITTIEMDPLQGLFDASASQAELVINGSANADFITGGAGVDTINGGAGNDTITVAEATSADTLAGNEGADTFKFSGNDIVSALKTSSGTTAVVSITDFVAGTDKIGIVDNGGGATSIVLSAAQDIGSAADLAAVYAGITQIAASAGGALSGSVITVTTGAAAGTYLYVNNTAGGVEATDDMLVNITGLTGTLTEADFVFA